MCSSCVSGQLAILYPNPVTESTYLPLLLLLLLLLLVLLLLLLVASPLPLPLVEANACAADVAVDSAAAAALAATSSPSAVLVSYRHFGDKTAWKTSISEAVTCRWRKSRSEIRSKGKFF
jgi:hypothetical protein